MTWSLVIIIVALAIIFIEKKMLTNRNMKKEQIVFCLMLVSGVILGIAENFIVIPTPLKMFSSIQQSIMAFIKL
ncbi:MAG: hypothetical protein H6Q73_2389 [Firmicutes bacterium]|nr:hypothetical protein [Bacillota bacterium]